MYPFLELCMMPIFTMFCSTSTFKALLFSTQWGLPIFWRLSGQLEFWHQGYQNRSFAMEPVGYKNTLKYSQQVSVAGELQGQQSLNVTLPPSCHRCKSLQVKALCSSFPSPVSNSMRKESSGNLTVIPLAVPKGSARTLQQSQGPTEQKSCSPYSSLDFSESHQHDSVLANTLRKAYFAWLVCQTCPNHFWVDQEVPRSLWSYSDAPFECFWRSVLKLFKRRNKNTRKEKDRNKYGNGGWVFLKKYGRVKTLLMGLHQLGNYARREKLF